MKKILTIILLFVSVCTFSQTGVDTVLTGQYAIYTLGDTDYTPKVTRDRWYDSRIGVDAVDTIFRVPATSPDDTVATLLSQIGALSTSIRPALLLERGSEKRTQITLPRSNMYVGAYGSGRRPILNGADLVTSWSDGSESSAIEDWSVTLDLEFNNSTYINFRSVIPSEDLSVSGTQIRIKIGAHSTNVTNISGASIGVRSGETDDFASAPTRITFDGGSNSTTIAAGVDKWSDWIDYTPDINTDQLVHIYTSDASGYTWTTSGSGAYRSTSGGDNTLTQTVDYGAISATYTRLLAAYEVSGTPSVPADSVWEAIVTTEPEIVLLSDTLGTESLTLNDVDTQGEWFWSGDTLYVYSEDSITNVYSKIEAGARQYGIVNKTYLNSSSETDIRIQSIEVKGTNEKGIALRNTVTNIPNSNIEISNCYVHHTRHIGFWLYRYEGVNISDSKAEYCGAGFYMSPNSNNNTFSRDTAMYNFHYESGVNTNGVGVDGSGFGVEESGNAIIEYCVAYENDASAYEIDPNFVEGYGTILRYNKALGALGSQTEYGIPSNNHGFFIARVGANTEILMHHNLSYDYGRNFNSNFFVEASGTGTNIKIYNNTFVNPSTVDGDIIRWFETTNTNVDFRNNIVVGYVNSANWQLHDATSNDFTYSDYNLFYGPNMSNPFRMAGVTYSNLSAWQTATSLDANSVAGNPLFTNEFTDFSLQTGSPAINAGVDVGLTQDINGNPIVGTPDIGAFEKQ